MAAMTDEQREAIRVRNLAKSFHGQSWADISALLADNEWLREELSAAEELKFADKFVDD